MLYIWVQSGYIGWIIQLVEPTGVQQLRLSIVCTDIAGKAGVETVTMSGGLPLTSIAPTDGQRSDAFDRFEDPDNVDFNLLMTGPASVDGTSSTTLAINNIDIVEKRKDSVVFISPYRQSVVAVVNGYTQTHKG